MFESIVTLSRRYIDFRMGAAGAIVMAVIVFVINYHGTADPAGATTAALKQGTYTLLFGGVIMRSCERLAIAVRSRFLALLLATLIPSAVAVGLTFGVHSLKGTPKPLASTVPTALFVIPSTAVWALMKRKKRNNESHIHHE